MSWKEKIQNTNDLIIFCKDWKTKDDIAVYFNLTPIEAWHCIKFARSLTSDFETKTQVGITKRAYAVRSRAHVLQEIGYL